MPELKSEYRRKGFHAPATESISSAIAEFSDTLRRNIGVVVAPVPDGQLHRVDDPEGRPNNRACWYVLHLDGRPAGAFGNWRTGFQSTWTAGARETLTPADLARTVALVQSARQQRERERSASQAQAQARARALWEAASPPPADHPYLTRKRVPALNLRHLAGSLLVPLTDTAGRLVNIQRIKPDGRKRFLPGGRIAGCFYLVGAPVAGKPLYLCEGWATGATIHTHTGAPIACAMSCGNLLAVGRELRRTFPEVFLIIAADDDRHTPGNPGRTAAIKAAEALRCGVVLPPWPDDAPIHLSDFNDLALWRSAR